MDIRNILSDDEMYALELLFDALKPLAPINKLVQSKVTIISVYAPILFAIKEHITGLEKKLCLQRRGFDVNTPLEKVNKYIDRIKFDYTIIGLASLSHVDGASVTEEFEIIPVRELAKIAYKMVVLDFISDPCERNTAGDSYEAAFTSAINRKNEVQETDEKSKVEASEQSKSEAVSIGNEDCKEIVMKNLETQIESELQEYMDFFFPHTKRGLKDIGEKNN